MKKNKSKKVKKQISKTEYGNIITAIKTKKYIPVWLDTLITLSILGALTYVSILSIYDFANDTSIMLFIRAVALSSMFILWFLVTTKYMLKLARGGFKHE